MCCRNLICLVVGLFSLVAGVLAGLGAYYGVIASLGTFPIFAFALALTILVFVPLFLILSKASQCFCCFRDCLLLGPALTIFLTVLTSIFTFATANIGIAILVGLLAASSLLTLISFLLLVSCLLKSYCYCKESC